VAGAGFINFKLRAAAIAKKAFELCQDDDLASPSKFDKADRDRFRIAERAKRCTSGTSAAPYSAMPWRGLRISSVTKSSVTITSAIGARSSGW